MTVMPELGALTLVRSLKLEDIMSTTDGWFATTNISFESIDVTLTSSLLPLSRLLSTFSYMSTRAMIVPQWSLTPVSMRSSSTWTHDMSAAARQIGAFTSLRCMIISPVFYVLQFIFLSISQLSSILIGT